MLPCGDRLIDQIGFNDFLLCPDFVFVHKTNSCIKGLFNFLVAPLSAKTFNLPFAHVFVCKVNGHSPGVGVCFFFFLRGSWKGRLHGVLAPCLTGLLQAAPVPKDMSVPA